MSDGMDCVCAAYSESECGCGADWTPQEVINLRQQLAGAQEEITVDEQRVADLMGDVNRLGQQLDDHLKREVMLRDALHWIACQPASGAIQCRATEALADTADLGDVRLCEKEPVGMMHESGNAIYAGCDCNIAGYTVQVFRAWRPK